MRLLTVIFIQVFLFSGCCWMSKRSCFPNCPPERVVTVNKCDIPPPPTIPGASPTSIDCPDKFVCYDEENAKNIYKRDTTLRNWVREVIKKCSPPVDSGLSPDAGSGGPL